jgi:hypothetical protein
MTMTMKTLAALSFSMLVIACGQDLPTSPASSRSQAAIQAAAGVSSTRRRAVSGGSSRPCANLAGTWDVHYEGSCPTDGYLGTWQLEQTGCAARTTNNPDAPAVSGAVNGATVKLSMRNGFIACTYQLDGTGTVSNGVINVVVAGPVGGPCCKGPTETVRVVATKR